MHNDKLLAKNQEILKMSGLLSPKVSILMAVYNGEKYLHESISSILNQTFQNFEFLIIDDGSTDATLEIIRKYIQQDSRIRLYANSHHGLIESLNYGLLHASGEYIARMDADDLSLSSRLEKQVDFLDNHLNIGVCGCWIRLIGSGIDQDNIYEYPISPPVIRCRMLFENPIPHPGVMFRTSILREHKLSYNSDYPHAEDYELFSRCSQVTELYNLPEALLCYRIHGNQVTRVYHETSLRTQKKIRIRLLSDLLLPTEDEIRIHELLCGDWEKKPDTKQIRSAERWLMKLISANLETKIYSQPVFSEEVAKVWFRLISQKKSDLYIFWKLTVSPFTPFLHLTFAEKVIYFYRPTVCFIKKVPMIKPLIMWFRKIRTSDHTYTQ
jgi:glycosyltransferase involved in cell wall biosynthesis